MLFRSKESAEHATIVDLIRNDLSINCSDIEVENYRYIDRIRTNKGDILQVSSCISGKIKNDTELGTLILGLLPAGSVSGAPKAKTLEIIKDSEVENRGYYTGIAGIYDGKNIDSCVLIRSLELDKDNNLWFRSGGGITAKSNMSDEYDELLKKVYLPFVV